MWANIIIYFCFTLPAILAANGVEPDFEFIKQLIEKKGVRTIEGLLSHLPDDYRRNFTLMHDSRSLQGATHENPRVIMFGKDAKLILAFNGEASQSKFNELEIIQYRKREQAFEFRKIEFPVSPGDRIKISGPNPDECTHCHTRELHPIWENYPVWPGAYLGYDDRPGSPRNQADLGPLTLFVKTAHRHNRYRFLANLEEGYSLEKFAEQQLGRTKLEHNSTFNLQVSQLNFDRLAAKLTTAPSWGHFKFVVVGALMYWCEVESLLPPNLAGRYREKYQALMNQQPKPVPLTARITVLDELMGGAFGNWFLNLNREDANLQTPGVGGRELTAKLVHSDHDFSGLLTLTERPAYGGGTPYFVAEPASRLTEKAFCEQLRKKSLSALSDWTGAKPLGYSTTPSLEPPPHSSRK